MAELPESEAEALEQHLLECDSCCEMARSFEGSDTLLDALRGEPTVTEDPEGEVVADVLERFRLVWPAAEARTEKPSPTSDPATGPYPALELGSLAPEEPARLGSYSLRKKLGIGGMGMVYEAEDEKLRRPAAVKILKPSLAGEARARERFRREAQAAAGIQHEHIVTIYQVDEDHGVPYLAMQLLQGESLQARLDRLGRLPVDEVLRIGREVAEGLAAAHARGLVHRDIKPSNIWLESARSCDRGGKVKILDFGLAWAPENGGRLTEPGIVLGTPGYMAPEQARGAGFDPRCDLFSLGCVLYQMSTGRPPFQGPDILATLVSLALDHPPEARAVNPEVPAGLSGLIRRLLGKDPSQRPSSMREVAAALAALQNDPSATPAVTVAAAPRRRVASLVAAACLLGGLAVFAYALTPPRGGRETPAASSADPEAVAAAPAADDADKADEKGDNDKPVYPVAILTFEERGAGVKDMGGKVTNLLLARLGEKEDLFLVDREDIKKTLEELELNRSGVVKAGEAARVGQLTGARLLVTGSVFQDGKKVNVVAKIIGTETSRTRSVSVEGKSDELGPAVKELADKLAGVVAKDADKLVARKVKETDRVEAINKKLRKGDRPVLWISVNERHLGQPRVDPAAQTELTYLAKNTGFTVIDPDEGGKSKADLVITGEAFSEFAGRRGGLASVKARVEIKVVDRKTDKVIAADRQTVVVVDVSEQIAGKNALQEGAAILAERLLPRLSLDKK